MGKKVALSIGGSDPSGGAGIQADLKSFSYLGIHGLTVITCVTSQNTQHVKKIHKVPAKIIENQIDVLFEDFDINAIKTGMLYDKEIIQCVVKKISEYNMNPVVDPVMIATSGDKLSQNNFVKYIKKDILSKTSMLTANVPEAVALTGIQIKSLEDVKKTCKKLYTFGPKYVLIKGGHLVNKNAVDILYNGKKFHSFSLPRLSLKKSHGSGCTLSALITGLLALDYTPVEAVRKAKNITWDMINESIKLGKGANVLNHSPGLIMPPSFQSNEHFNVWLDLKNAIEKLVLVLPTDFIPEVGMNFAYALKNAKKINEICAVEGRIIKIKDKVKICGNLDFGTSKHVASIILAAMNFDENSRCALNIHYSKNNLNMCKKVDFSIGTFDRKNEPVNANSTMEWGTKKAISELGFVPDIIYDTGDIGKEPMIRVLGNSPKDVFSKLQRLLEKLHR